MSYTLRRTIKNHIKDLLLLFSIPLGIFILMLAVVYIPRMLAHPSYDFIYAICDQYQCDSRYSVDESRHITKSEADEDAYDGTYSSSLHYYDAKSDATRTLTLAEAKRYELNKSSRSPDGYVLKRANADDTFFGGNSDASWYLKKGLKQKKVDLSYNEYYTTVSFLGWVKK